MPVVLLDPSGRHETVRLPRLAHLTDLPLLLKAVAGN
jgi:hypothetical protein